LKLPFLLLDLFSLSDWRVAGMAKKLYKLEFGKMKVSFKMGFWSSDHEKESFLAVTAVTPNVIVW
jgi:hypothetical protein